ncbi:hypothetical protein [Blautia obeum]|uniref:Cap15 family cyclic dinucleotide receptor domain-containing protein n=1 Tax=Blautia obeum TaxID=40520 RepID=UPI0035695F8E
MAESYSKFTSKSIWLTIAMFCLRCFLSGTKIIAEFSIYDLYGYAGEAIAFSAFVMLVYEKWLWRYNPLEETPVLKKKYRGTLLSTYDGIERDATLEIKQTLLSINVIFITGESRSKSISSSIEKIQEEWQLTYCYLNVPQANVRDRSAIHYGTALLCIEDPEEIKGQYFTDRKTTGDMHFVPE